MSMQIHPLSDSSGILESLNLNGIAVINDIIPHSEMRFLANRVSDIFSSPLGTHRNGYIRSGNNKFISYSMLLPHSLAIYANEELLKIADSYCGSFSHLSNHRIYQNLCQTRFLTKPMKWHKDNKLDYINQQGNHITTMVQHDKGLILILYLSDTTKGGTQFKLDTHSYRNDIECFEEKSISQFQTYTANNLPIGTGILYDYRMIHRAQPTYSRNHQRISLFAQYSPCHMPNGEPIHIGSSVVKSLSDRQRRLLNIDSENGLPTAPNWPLDASHEGYLPRAKWKRMLGKLLIRI
jgi:hypothetical protein